MIDRDLEQRLRAWYRADIGDRERAPLQLRTDLATLAQTAPTPQRRWTAAWRFPTMNRFAPLALAATAVVVALLIGISFILRSPNVGPSPLPGPTHNETPGPTARAAAWTATGSMITPRILETATLLRDGRVLVAGGSNLAGVNGNDILASAELYDPSSGSWTATGSMITPRISHTATLLRDGRVLVAGGSSAFEGSLLASAELYDPSSGSWTATGNMDAPGKFQTATLLPDGRVLVAGGSDVDGVPLASAALYDASSGTWTATGNMITPRSYLGQTAMLLLLDGRVLAVEGGTAELYDPGTGTWTATGRMITLRSSGTATLLPDGRVLVAGGCGPDHCVASAMASAELYDPSSGTWTATRNMVLPHSGQTATLLRDGKVLVAGGGQIATSDGFEVIPQYFAELYDPGSGSWTLTASMSKPRIVHTATLLRDGKVLVVGGNSFFTGTIGAATAELYDPGSP